MRKELMERLADFPVVPAIRSSSDISEAIRSEARVVFLLFGRLGELEEPIRHLKKADKLVFLHVDLVEGLSGDGAVIDYIKRNTQVDGILSTRAHLIERARENRLLTVGRYFLLDSKSLENTLRAIQRSRADLHEVLPAVSSLILQRIQNQSQVPLIAGGLVNDRREAMRILAAGVRAVSTSCKKLWTDEQ